MGLVPEIKMDWIGLFVFNMKPFQFYYFSMLLEKCLVGLDCRIVVLNTIHWDQWLK